MPNQDTSLSLSNRTRSSWINYTMIVLAVFQLIFSAYTTLVMESELEELDGKTDRISYYNMALALVGSMLFFAEVAVRAPLSMSALMNKDKVYRAALRDPALTRSRVFLNQGEFSFELPKIKPRLAMRRSYRIFGAVFALLTLASSITLEYVDASFTLELSLMYAGMVIEFGMGVTSLLQAEGLKEELKASEQQLTKLASGLKAKADSLVKANSDSLDLETGKSNLSPEQIKNNRLSAERHNKLSVAVSKILSGQKTESYGWGSALKRMGTLLRSELTPNVAQVAPLGSGDEDKTHRLIQVLSGGDKINEASEVDLTAGASEDSSHAQQSKGILSRNPLGLHSSKTGFGAAAHVVVACSNPGTTIPA